MCVCGVKKGAEWSRREDHDKVIDFYKPDVMALMETSLKGA